MEELKPRTTVLFHRAYVKLGCPQPYSHYFPSRSHNRRTEGGQKGETGFAALIEATGTLSSS